ncbi:MULTISPECIES: DUF6894 family protein [Rhizobium]|uniref:DUF6894 domain-containing protein n=1 Tax=Rhizobium favelukesii TaxID=348824 RepID=W6RUT2_9HYPH|nr:MULTISPECIES: hypothetical protein [Rhizobium]MCS0457904.1 hypothetical protein [Rhizobium favelukesii]UFS78959.1 hypothetical protein LPB79_04820 [Rhizobium sp. T136]CDM62418.1 hypothetical protein LPU83_pLPU83d_1048 [Rhizobium favelukesii]
MHGPKLKRFFFHVRKGKELVRDREGALFNDVGDAITEALICAKTGRGHKGNVGSTGKAFEITDETGKLLATVPIA